MVIIKTFPTLFLLKRIIFVSLIASNALFAVSIPRGGNIMLRNQIEDTSSTTSEKKSYSLYLSEDNYGDHSTGIYKTTFGGSVRDPFGYGEKISGNFSMSDQDLRLGSLQISLPVGSHLGVFAAGVSHLHYALGDTFAPLEVSGSVRAVWMGYAQSLWKNHHDGLSYRIKIAQNRMIDDIGSEGGGRNQRSTTTVRNSLALTNSDRYGGVNVALIHFLVGKLSDDIQEDPYNKGGRYRKLNVQLQRSQTLGSFTLVAQLKGQKGYKNLDASEKFDLTDLNGVGGYYAGDIVGDDGILGVLELTHPLVETMNFSLLYANGAVKTLHTPIDDTQNLHKASSIGMKLSYTGSYGIGANVGMYKRVTGEDVGNYDNPYHILFGISKRF
jgi:hemolysin activation/secretion protein